jgi:hypothetical protein
MSLCYFFSGHLKSIRLHGVPLREMTPIGWIDRQKIGLVASLGDVSWLAAAIAVG